MEQKPREWYENQPLTIEALEDGCLNLCGLKTSQKKYSLDGGGSWVLLGPKSEILVEKGTHVMIASIVSQKNPIIGRISTSFKFNVYGNVKSLACGLKFQKKRWPSQLKLFRFFENSNIIDASNLILPMDTMDMYCYSSMFRFCVYLVRGPQLQSTTLTQYCYSYMFEGCIRLREAPQLPATTLGHSCYTSMFRGCTSLKEAPQLPAMELTECCYESMFEGCKSLKEAPQLPATTLANSCYYRMFLGCTSLEVGPLVLPAKILPPYCYYNMFSGCISLLKAPKIFGRIAEYESFRNMFDECLSLSVTPHRITIFDGLKRCGHDDMFINCHKLDKKVIVIDVSKLV